MLFQPRHIMRSTGSRHDRVFSRCRGWSDGPPRQWGTFVSASGAVLLTVFPDVSHMDQIEASSSSSRWQGPRTFSILTGGLGVSRSCGRPR
jgi:hypothetical protein